MKKTLIITFFLWTLSTVNAQKRAIYYNMMPLLSLYHVNLELGYAHEFRNGFCSDFGFGIIIPPDLWNNDRLNGTGRKKGRGFLLHFEPKYVFPSTEGADMEHILALKTSVFLHNYQSKRYLDSTLQTITFDVKTKGFMANLLFGVTAFHRDNSFMEMTFGMGVRGTHIDNNSPVPLAQMYEQFRINQTIEPEEKGNYLKFMLMINFKAGIAF